MRAPTDQDYAAQLHPRQELSGAKLLGRVLLPCASLPEKAEDRGEPRGEVSRRGSVELHEG
jgi:hypothetical protein